MIEFNRGSGVHYDASLGGGNLLLVTSWHER
jgi:hypothetical protein